MVCTTQLCDFCTQVLNGWNTIEHTKTISGIAHAETNIGQYFLGLESDGGGWETHCSHNCITTVGVAILILIRKETECEYCLGVAGVVL